MSERFKLRACARRLRASLCALRESCLPSSMAEQQAVPKWARPSAAVLRKAFCWACHGPVSCKQSRSHANPNRFYLTCSKGVEDRETGCGEFFQWADALPCRLSQEVPGHLYASQNAPPPLQRRPSSAVVQAMQCPQCHQRDARLRCTKRDNGNYGRWFCFWCARFAMRCRGYHQGCFRCCSTSSL